MVAGQFSIIIKGIPVINASVVQLPLLNRPVCNQSINIMSMTYMYEEEKRRKKKQFEKTKKKRKNYIQYAYHILCIHVYNQLSFSVYYCS